ncbi:MAG: helicase-exonuclease AddAB subunit AddA, partial [Lachnospiraceae bacterium]|nr:helicase-exonuclease AddAB subunit AddA [Lachnospiraceae bacterium]
HNNDTELLIYDTQDGDEEAHGIASKIKQLTTSFQVTDSDTGLLRKACYRDIVILLRTTTGWDEEFKRILEEEGIPAHVTSKTGYFASTEIQELLHFLRILDNPMQDIPLYGVMHSVFGGFSEEEIAVIKAEFPKKRYMYDAVREYAEAENKTELQQKLRNFISKIEQYRDMAVYMPVHELLQVIIRDYSYLSYVAAKPGGSRRRANVEMLLVKAADYEKTSYYGLYHFLRYIEQLEKYDVDYGEANLQDENADVVRIMSIHKSKGLEFPICFVVGLSKSFNNRDTNGHLVMDVEEGLGVDYINPEMRISGRNLRRNYIAAKLKQDNLAEELRILYVAMTRAKEKLILTGK